MPRGVDSGQRRRENRKYCYCPLCPDSTKRISSSLWQRHQDAWRARTFAQQQPLAAADSPEPKNHEDKLPGFDTPLIEVYKEHCSDTEETSTSDPDETEHESISCSDSDDDSVSDNTFFTGDVSLNNLSSIASWEIADPELKEAIAWYIWKAEHAVSDTAFENRPMPKSLSNYSIYRLKKALRRLSGLSFTKIVCCVNVCAAFEDESIRVCTLCNEDLYETVELTSGRLTRARKHSFYFDPIPRLILDYAMPKVSQEMHEYMDYIAEMRASSSDQRHLVDFWTSQVFDDLESDYFQDKRTLSLSYTTDGVSTTRQRSHSIWPGVLVNNNLPPEIRYRRLMIVMIIPGPNEPRDMGSFYPPFLKSLELLTHGVNAYDGWRKEEFLLQAHLCLVTGDGPALAKMMGLKGANAMSPCRYCHIQGEGDPTSNHKYYPYKSRSFVNTDWDGSNDKDDICLRSNLRMQIVDAMRSNDPALQKQYGISTLSWFLDVKTLDFPRSFGIDIMHLFGNIAKMFWKIWTGAMLWPGDDDHFDYSVLSKRQQEEIGLDLKHATRSVPVSVSRTTRSIEKHQNSFKSSEWFDWILIYSLPLLHGELSDNALLSWESFVRGVEIAMKVDLTTAEVHSMEEHFRNFVNSSEEIYYQGFSNRLPMCTAQMHMLLHVGQCILDIGPPFVLWQFGVERYVGMLTPLVTSKSQQDESLYHSVTVREQMRYVQELYQLQSSRHAPAHNRKEVRDEQGLIGYLQGPVKNANLGHNVRLLNAYYTAFYQCSVQTHAEYRDWTSCVRPVRIGTANECTISTSTLRNNIRRARNAIMFTMVDDNDVEALSYGRVTSFIEHTPFEGHTFHFALVRKFVTSIDPLTNCLYTAQDGPMTLIELSDIEGPIGTITRAYCTATSLSSRRIWYAIGYRIAELC